VANGGEAVRSSKGVATNLPARLSSFVGRERELTELAPLLSASRVLTLTGTGGSGKTRLALELARGVAPNYPDGVWLISLGPVLEDGLVVQTLASVLDVRERSGESLLASVSKHLRNRRALMILDGCEHLVDRCAQLTETLLQSCSQLTILATSQEALRVTGEATWAVPSLSIPPADGPMAVAQLMASESVRLFVERAALVQHGFKLTEHTGVIVAQICRRLDGLPLAIELAAARIRLMPVEELESRLEDRFRLLTGGSRTAVARHQALRATVDWSYEQLGEAEQALFIRLAVFSGSFTLEAVEAICTGGPVRQDVLESLTRLADRSLVQVTRASDGARYRLLETLKHYGQERLGETAGDGSIRERHARYYRALAEEVDAHLVGHDQVRQLARLEHDRDNLRAALTWSLSGDVDLALRLATATGRFWYIRGYLTEGQEWLNAAIAKTGTETPTLARALSHAGWVAYWQGDYERSRSNAQASLAIARRLRDPAEIARAVNLLGGILHIADEDFTAARRCYEEAAAIRHEIGDVDGAASSVNNVALAAFDAGDFEAARTLLEQVAADPAAVRDRRTRATYLDSLARVAYEQGDYTAARAYHGECMAIALKLGDKVNTVDAIEGFARLAVADGHPERSLTLAAAARALRDRIGYEVPKPWSARLQRSLAQAEAALTPAQVETARMVGARLGEADAAALALESVRDRSAQPQAADRIPLTPREREIAALVAAGLGNRQIANQLKISERTADAHVEHIRNKLGVHSRVQIAQWASRHGLVVAGTVAS
jgi:predicted ATPase/DNA-binding CsgD family transcriptional regulator